MAEKNAFLKGILHQRHENITFANCSNPASPTLIVDGSVYTRNTLRFIPAFDQIKLIFTCRGLKHTHGSTIWMQQTSESTFGGYNPLRSCFDQNKATDFGTC